jgi:predicted GNAT family acetyltransferase
MAGFIELRTHPNAEMQISFLGVSPRKIGRGIGKQLVLHAIELARSRNMRRLWVYTRNYDGPYALRNYLRRGFKVFKTRPETVAIPPGEEAEARRAVLEAKRRGVYPPLIRRIEAILRCSPPGEMARRLVRRYRDRKECRKAGPRTGYTSKAENR